MQITGESIKIKLDYSGNETKALGIVDCQCGRKVIIDQPIQDSSFDFINEKANAISINEKIVNPDLPDALVLQEKLNKAIVLIDYLLANGMFNATIIEKANTDKQGLI